MSRLLAAVVTVSVADFSCTGQGRRLLSDALKRRRSGRPAGNREGLSAKWLGALAGVSGGGSKWEGVDESGIITRRGHGDRTAGRVLTFGRRSYWAFSSSVLSYTFTAVSPADSATPPKREAVVEA